MGGNDDYSDQLEQQNRQAMAEIEQKKQSLYQTRLDIIKGQGQQSWTPRPNPSPGSLETSPPAEMFRKGRTAQAERNQWYRDHPGRR